MPFLFLYNPLFILLPENAFSSKPSLSIYLSNLTFFDFFDFIERKNAFIASSTFQITDWVKEVDRSCNAYCVLIIYNDQGMIETFLFQNNVV